MLRYFLCSSCIPDLKAYFQLHFFCLNIDVLTIVIETLEIKEEKNH